MVRRSSDRPLASAHDLKLFPELAASSADGRVKIGAGPDHDDSAHKRNTLTLSSASEETSLSIPTRFRAAPPFANGVRNFPEAETAERHC